MLANPLSADWLRGTLTVCVLGILAEGDSYGYAITQRLEDAGVGAIKGGTLYPLLARLETHGLVTSVWQTRHGSPSRKYLHLTDAGRAELVDLRKRWRLFSAAVDHLAHLSEAR